MYRLANEVQRLGVEERVREERELSDTILVPCLNFEQHLKLSSGDRRIRYFSTENVMEWKYGTVFLCLVRGNVNVRLEFTTIPT